MSSTYKLTDASAHFSEVVDKPAKRVPGLGEGIVMAPDFDAPLDDFKDYQ